tara:strand:+ start:538 stop:1218 length:681 start_codon:yes stop_codon:yes gene_type:complete
MKKNFLKNYEKAGYVVIKNFISKKEIKILKKEVELISNKYDIKNIFKSKEKSFWKKNLNLLNKIRLELNYNNKTFQNFYRLKKFFDVTKKIKKKNSKKFTIDKVRFNIPGNKKSAHPWHQDEITWPNKINQKPITFWVPLVNIDKNNGIEFAIGNQRNNYLIPHKMGKDPKTTLKYATIQAKSSLKNRVIPKLKIGDVIIFDNFLPHRSCSNTSKKIRISIDTRFK